MCRGIQGMIQDGKLEGMREGKMEGIQGMAELFRELGLSDDWMIEKLREKFSMTRQEAERVLAGTKKG